MAASRRVSYCVVFLLVTFFIVVQTQYYHRLYYQTVSRFVVILVVATFLALVVVFVARRFCDSLIFHPDSPPESRSRVASPSAFGLSFEEIFLLAKDGVKLHVFFVSAPNEKKEASTTPPPPTLLFFHGNSGNITGRLGVARQLVQLGASVFLFDYRGGWLLLM